jgi:hypothetical protein
LTAGTNGMSTGYFSSVVKDINAHVAAFILCSATQVYWWLFYRGFVMEDVNKLIRQCFMLSQQQKVNKLKYIKDEETDADVIINAAMIDS